MELGVRGRAAIVTGGGKGIGRAIAHVLADEGVSVAIGDIDHYAAEQVSALIRSRGGRSIACRADVSDRSQVNELFDCAVGEFGSVEYLVNNAGISSVAHIEELTDEIWDRVMNVNMKGTLYCCQAVLPTLKRQRSGAIVNVISSVVKTGAAAPYGHYVASKAAMWGFTKRLARETAPFGIRANGVAPGTIETDLIRETASDARGEADKLIPLGRIGTPREVAATVLFLLSDMASYITGELINVNGGAVMD